MLYLTTTVTARNSPHLSAKNLGTGNVLFQIASVYGIAKRLGREAEYRSVKEYCQHIQVAYGYDHGNTLYRNCLTRPAYSSREVCEHLLEKRVDNALLRKIEESNENIRIHGYLECPTYFHEYRDELLTLFSPDVQSLLRISEQYPELFSKTCVAIHIRVGADANTRCDKRYYQEAVRYINQRVKDPFYLVFSDGDVDVSDLGIQHYRVVRGNPDYIDLWTMSLCHHAITSYSTFSWWGSYLNVNREKIITYPRSALLYIQSRNGDSEANIHSHYFLNNTQIKDT